MKGHFKKAGVAPVRDLHEIRLDAAPEVEAGSDLTVAEFSESAKVDVIGVTKGRGFQGVVKRWNFAGGRPLTAPCSIVAGDPTGCANAG
jgi:large subunit ribosomal protein L3